MSYRIRTLWFKLRKALSNQKQYQELLRRSGVAIGNGCEIYKDVMWGSEPYLITIGDNVRITSGCRFITHDGGAWVLRNYKQMKDIDLIREIKIGNNVHIGINAIIMPGVTIGNNCVIGCGAVVTKDIPDNSVAAGMPARIIEDIDTYYDKNKRRFIKTKEMSQSEKRDYLERRRKSNG